MPYQTALLPETKVCSACSLAKDSSSFRTRRYKNGKQYLYSICKSCEKHQHYEYVDQNKEALKKYSRDCYLKKVGKLKKQSPLSSDKSITALKKRISNEIWRKNNPEKVLKARLRQKENGNEAAKSAKRRAAKRQAIPKWADMQAIKDV